MVTRVERIISIVKSSLCYYGGAYIFVKGTKTVSGTSAAADPTNNTNLKVITKNCTPLPKCRSEMNDTQIDNARDIDVVILMYNLIEYRDNQFLKIMNVLLISLIITIT